MKESPQLRQKLSPERQREPDFAMLPYIERNLQAIRALHEKIRSGVSPEEAIQINENFEQAVVAVGIAARALAQQAAIDPLTALPNKGAFHMSAEHQLALWCRQAHDAQKSGTPI